MSAATLLGVAGLLAQRDNWSRLGDRFSGHHLRLQTEDIVGGVVLLVAGLLLYFGLNYAWSVSKRLSSKEPPRDVFRRLVQAHRLTRAEERVLREIAEQAGLKKPAEVFVRPELFTEAARRRPQTERLAGQLFAHQGRS